MNPPTISWGLRATALFALLIVGFVAVATQVVPPLIESNPQGATVLALAMIAAVGAAGILALRATAERRGAIEGVLSTLAPWLPGALAVGIVGPFLLGQSASSAIAIGVIATAVGWLVIGFLFAEHARADTAQPRNYATIVDRFTRLRADADVFAAKERLGALQPEALENALSARAELLLYIDALARDLGLAGTAPASGRTWALGSGYIDLWNRLHRAEEALIDLTSDANVIASALHDGLRLQGSSIGHAKELTSALNDAVKTLRDDTDIGHRVQARRTLRNIRRDINQFRDDVWDQMLDLRHQLLTRMVFTGVIADIILILALVVGVEAPGILAASAFYLVGAVIGLFARLQAESSTDSTVDDYGLANARLMVTPLISGIAAVAGVVLTAKLLLPGSDVLAPPIVDSSEKTLSLAGEVRTPAEMADIFDLDVNAGGLVVAAIFGLTPGLVLERLKSEAERYKSDLQTSTPTDGGKK